MDMNALRLSLPIHRQSGGSGSGSGEENVDDPSGCFRLAALYTTKLYKSLIRERALAHDGGYRDGLQDVYDRIEAGMDAAELKQWISHVLMLTEYANDANDDTGRSSKPDAVALDKLNTSVADNSSGDSSFMSNKKLEKAPNPSYLRPQSSDPLTSSDPIESPQSPKPPSSLLVPDAEDVIFEMLEHGRKRRIIQSNRQ